jgi:hypothetical protein
VEWPRGAPDPIWEGGPGGEAAGDDHRRRTRVAAAAVCFPARWQLGGRRERAGEL